MASLVTDKGKRGDARRILFKHRDGKRKPIRLGLIPLTQARTILAHVQRLEACQFDGSAPPPQTAAWLKDISNTLRAKLVAHGLAAVADERRCPTLSELIAEFKERPTWRSQRPKTTKNYLLFFRHLTAGLGAAKQVVKVTEADADTFSGYLSEAKPTGAGLGRASANRICGGANTLFRFAVRSRIIDRNPFEGIDQGAVATTRRAYVDADLSRRVLAAIDDDQLKLVFALSRWGGLRVPSEPRELRWGDIDRANNRIVVTSPKTAQHRGHESRVIPLFPELEPIIQQRWDNAEEGDEYVIPMLRLHGDSIYSTRLAKILKGMGIEPWPRLFHSMRSTRQTELTEVFPAHVVSYWLGNSEKVAAKHYLQVTDDHFEKAARNAAQPASASVRHDKTTQGSGDDVRLDSRNVSNAVATGQSVG